MFTPRLPESSSLGPDSGVEPSSVLEIPSGERAIRRGLTELQELCRQTSQKMLVEASLDTDICSIA